jgi:hypothetical protein
MIGYRSFAAGMHLRKGLKSMPLQHSLRCLSIGAMAGKISLVFHDGDMRRIAHERHGVVKRPHDFPASIPRDHHVESYSFGWQSGWHDQNRSSALQTNAIRLKWSRRIHRKLADDRQIGQLRPCDNLVEAVSANFTPVIIDTGVCHLGVKSPMWGADIGTASRTQLRRRSRFWTRRPSQSDARQIRLGCFGQMSSNIQPNSTLSLFIDRHEDQADRMRADKLGCWRATGSMMSASSPPPQCIPFFHHGHVLRPAAKPPACSTARTQELRIALVR